jgi:hypothetical protein
MSTIPPNWLGSVLGTPAAQQQATAAKNKEAVDQAARSGAAKFTDSLHNVIENSDRDAQAYADSEGLGSQGRPFAEESEPGEQQAPDERDGTDATGGAIDVQA